MTGSWECARLQTVCQSTREMAWQKATRQEAESNAVHRTTQQRALLTPAHYSVSHYAHYRQPSTPPRLRCCSISVLLHLTTPPLLKVRLSIRGAINPYVLPLRRPRTPCPLHRVLTLSSLWPRLPGCRRIAASAARSSTSKTQRSPSAGICACVWRVAFRNPIPAVPSDPGCLANEWRWCIHHIEIYLSLTLKS